MHREKPLSIQEIKNMSTKLEDLGYKSLLLVVNANDSDNWIKVAHAINPNEKLKYLIALRPYMISPTMCAMMVRSFNEISPNRLSLNIVSGQIGEHEPVPDKHFDVDSEITTIDGRLDYVSKFLEDFDKIPINSGRPELLVGTGNPEIIKHVKKYTDISLCMYDDFERNDLSSFKRKMVSIQVVVRDSQEEADYFMQQFEGTRQIKNAIYGTRDSVVKKIIELKNKGITDVLISPIFGDPDSIKALEIIKHML